LLDSREVGARKIPEELRALQNHHFLDQRDHLVLLGNIVVRTAGRRHFLVAAEDV